MTCATTWHGDGIVHAQGVGGVGVGGSVTSVGFKVGLRVGFEVMVILLTRWATAANSFSSGLSLSISSRSSLSGAVCCSHGIFFHK